MNLICAFQKYHYLNANKITSNKLYKPHNILMYPVTKYTMPNYFVKEPNRIPMQKVLYINTDLEYNLDENNTMQNVEVIKTKNKYKSNACILIPFLLFSYAYYNYYYK